MRNQLSFALWIGSVGVVATLTAASCTMDFDEFTFNPTVSSSGTGGTAGSGGTTGGGGVGGTPECTSPDQCGTDTTCLTMTCDSGTCGTQNTAINTECTEDNGQFCDGLGACVECNNAEQCGPGYACEQHVCLSEDCINNVLDDHETDIDCGGDLCPPCVNGLICEDYSDCESQFCDSLICAPCTGDPDCVPVTDAWCDASVEGGTCADKKADGEPCNGSNECLSASCPGDDNVCCDTLCNSQCVSCLGSSTGGTDGTCDWVSAGTDPDNECGVDSQVSCGSDGTGCSGSSSSCNIWSTSTVCSPVDCTGSTLTPEGLCDGTGSCNIPPSSSCDPGYACNAAGDACIAPGGCSAQSHCNTGFYCDTSSGNCVPEELDGTTCNDGYECISGFCVDGVCCNELCNSQCRSCLGASTGAPTDPDGTCASVTNLTDPDVECSDVAGPCGPDGTGCNGHPGNPHCNGSSCTCEEQYPLGGDVLIQCGGTANQCELQVDTSTTSCADICAAGGGECLGYWDNTGNCGHSTPGTCADVVWATAICRCSRGCGGGAACVLPFTCQAGDCVL